MSHLNAHLVNFIMENKRLIWRTCFHYPSVHQLGFEDAIKACNSFEGNWTVTRKAHGSIICSTVPWTKNCNKCNTWRMLVWMDGACEKIKNDFTPCKANLNTKIGHYYCGHNPCTDSGDFLYGGVWGAGIKGLY